MDLGNGSLTVVIPVYNEVDNIQPLLERLGAALASWPGALEILFVDDGSTDRTLDLLKEAQRSDSLLQGIRIAHFGRHLGQTAAMAAGFRLARGRAVATLVQRPARKVAWGHEWEVYRRPGSAHSQRRTPPENLPIGL